MQASTKPRRRLERDARCRVIVTDRDRMLLFDLFLLKAARREHLQRLHFTSVPRCNQRLRALFDTGHLDRYASPYGPVGPVLYALGAAARDIVRVGIQATCPEFSEHDFRSQCRKAKSGLVMHTLAIADVYVAFKTRLHSDGPVRLLRYLPEAVVRQEFDIRRTEAPESGTSAWRRITVAPDGCFVLIDADNGTTHALLLEADRGDTGSQIVSKLHGYSHFIKSGLAEQLVGTSSVTVAFVTTGPGRAQNLCRLAEEAELDAVAVSTFAEVERLDADAPLWRMPRNTALLGLHDVMCRKGA